MFRCMSVCQISDFCNRREHDNTIRINIQSLSHIDGSAASLSHFVLTPFSLSSLSLSLSSLCLILPRALCHDPVLDWEVEQGLSAKSPPEDFCHCYKRIIPDLLFNLRSEHAPNYIDLLKGQAELNHTFHEAHQRFIQIVHGKVTGGRWREGKRGEERRGEEKACGVKRV